MEDTKFCALHTRGDAEASIRTQYNLSKYRYRNRYDNFYENEALRSLRDEVALARTVLEERMNMINNSAEFIAACPQLNTLFLTVERLVNTCHRLETSLGSLLSKPTLLRIVQKIVDILTEEMASVPNHEAIIDKLSDRIIEVVLTAAPRDEEKKL
jgi:hypothetical protein